MEQKRKRLAIGLFTLLCLCAVIDLVSGHTGAALCALGAGIFYLMVSFSAEK